MSIWLFRGIDGYLASLDLVRDLDVDLALPGHRRLITDHRSRIDQLKEHHHGRCDEILRIMSNGVMTAYVIASQMTWDIKCDSWEAFPLAQKWFATGEAISHLRYLKEKGQIYRIRENRLSLYHSTDCVPGKGAEPV
jgi:hypothetical protein